MGWAGQEFLKILYQDFSKNLGPDAPVRAR
jgi:hypothetical protein